MRKFRAHKFNPAKLANGHPTLACVCGAWYDDPIHNGCATQWSTCPVCGETYAAHDRTVDHDHR